MYANLAQLGLVVSIIISLYAPISLVWTYKLDKNQSVKDFEAIILIQFVFTTFAFFSLVYAYVCSDFSLYNVSRNSHLAVPLIFKISGVWSNHEGSMLLWLFILNLINTLFISNKLSALENIWVRFVQIVITSSLTLYTVLESNPFIKIFPVPLQGNGFNPLLQDFALAIHPPILYIGFVSTVILFAVAVSSLINKSLSGKAIYYLQKWALFSWSFLTLGIALGSWWAYRELGWGGYWFWDPVENASLLPWLTTSALIHSLYINKKMSLCFRWSILLSLITFLLAILATFFVRSGVVTSVHTFASDPSRGIFILKLLVIYSVFSLSIYGFKAHHFITSTSTSWCSRYGSIYISNICWALGCMIIVGSLLFPLYSSMINGVKITIDREYFEACFIPFLLVILSLISVGLPAAWTQITKIQIKHLYFSLIISSIFTIIFYIFLSPSLMSTITFFVGIIVVIRMLFWLKLRMETGVSIKFILIFGVHLAAGLLALNLALVETSSKELLVKMKEGDHINFGSYKITFIQKENFAVENYLAGRVVLDVKKDQNELTYLKPEVRYYPVEKKQTSEADIYHELFLDLYAVINETTELGEISVKFYIKPFMSFVWIIIFVIFILGILLIFDFKKRNNAIN